MKINKVTFTGADDKVDINQLIDINKENSFIEWGILLSNSKKGSNRYPSVQWVNKLIKNDTMVLSAHLCGKLSRQIIEEKNYTLLCELKRFNRVQINYNFNNYTTHYLDELIEYSYNKRINIILQYNKSNKYKLNNYKFPSNFNLLYDSSGGRGTEIKNIENPFNNHTGYAGGLNENNIKNIISKIENHQNKSNVWIDFESGIRTNNEFDLNKIDNIIRILKDPCFCKSLSNTRCIEEDFEFFNKHGE